MRPITRAALATLLFSIVSIVAAGCATQETPVQHAQRIEPLLSAAGFRALPADTPARQAKLQSLTPLKIRFFPHNGKMHYWYADPYYCNCIFSGNEKAYDAYESIRTKQQIANEQEETSLNNEDAAAQENMDFMAWPANEVFFGGE
jgi:hypothetical protein